VKGRNCLHEGDHLHLDESEICLSVKAKIFTGPQPDMTPFRRRLLLKCLELFDIGAIGFSFALATLAFYYKSNALNLLSFLSVRIKIQNFVFFLLFLFGGHASYSGFGLYKSHRLSTRGGEVLDILKATGLGTLILWLSGKIFHFTVVSPLFVVVFFVASTTSMISSRLGLRWFLEWIRRLGRNLRYLLIVGTNPRAVRFAREVEARPELGYKIVGFVDDEWAGTGEFRQNGYALVAGLADLKDYLRHNVVDEVVIDLPVKSLYQVAAQIVASCEEQGIIVRHLPNLFTSRSAVSGIANTEEPPTVTLRTGERDNFALLLKRAIDAFLSFVAILALSPLFLGIALLIKLSSPGPILFIHDRIGLNKRRFRLLKFRTMVPDAEKRQTEFEEMNEMEGPVFKIRNDPRITRIGRILRRSSLDELPQLFNVLRGDMSLVGPRPLPVRDYEGFDSDRQRRRFSVRPGITCLWQVNGRSSVPFEKWMEMDMQYIDQWSLALDFKILAKTIRAVLKGAGAA
jgi:exopolysaccharide biosynthesis polyprenyl glycosylphosphotransferase